MIRHCRTLRIRWRAHHDRHEVRRQRSDAGFTLVELGIAVALLGVLVSISSLVVVTMYRTTSRVTTTYTNVNQQLWLATNLQRLVRSAVAPAPSFSGSTPIPAFTYATSPPTATSMTFYTNTGTTNGPEKVTAKCTATPVHTTLCRKTPPATFTISITPANPTTCPRTNTKSYNAAHHRTSCVWGTTKTLVRISHVTNGVNNQALFIYAWHTPTAATGSVKTVCAANVTTTCSGTDAIFDSCRAATTGTPTFSNCTVGDIQSVTYDLQINDNRSTLNGGQQAEDDTGIFALSSTSTLFDPAVG